MADQVAQEQVAGAGIAGALFRDPPTVTVTAPIGLVTSTTTTVTWSYTSSLSKPQLSYRVQLLNQSATVVLFDSSVVASAATSYACPFLLSGSSAYTVRVTCSDGVDEGSDDDLFTTDLADVADFPPEPKVGSVYEVAINGVGLMLADTPQRPYKRSTGQLQSPRFATGETPFAEAVERYTFVGSGDWSYGTGQALRDRETSDPRGYHTSENVDPFTPGELRLLPTTSTQVSSSETAQMAVVASGNLYARTASTDLKHMATLGGSQTTLTFPAALAALTSDGSYWYAATTAELIYRGTGTSVGAAWSDLSAQTSDIKMMEWVSDRLAVVYVNGSGQHVLSTLGPSGTEEVAAGRFKYTDAEITAVTAGDGYVWFSVNRTDRSVIYAWNLGSTDAPFIAVELPRGERCRSLYYYLGNVMIRTSVVVDATTTGASVYRAVPTNGELTPERVATFEKSGSDLSAGPFTGLDRFILFGYPEMSDDGRSGVGALDLSTGGWCRWVQAPALADDGAVQSLFVWNNRVGFTVSALGAVVETTTPCATGYLDSSVADLGSGLSKVIDALSLVTEPLPASASVAAAVSVDGGNSFIPVGTATGAGVKGGDWDVAVETKVVSYRLTLTASAASPVVRIVQLKLHPLSLVDVLVELPVDCSDRMVGQNGVEIQDALPVGLARARFLESLVGTRVSFQDVDWPITNQSEVWEVVSAETTTVGTFSSRLGRREETAPVCVVSMRRAL